MLKPEIEESMRNFLSKDFPDLKQDLYNLYLRRGNVYVYKESWDKAIADFMTVERQLLPGPQKAGLYRKIAAVYELKGDARNAARYRQKAQDEDRGVKK